MVSSILKPKFLEVDTIKKQSSKKENSINKQKTICSICGFLLDVNSGGWIDFVVRCEYLFLKNICSYDELEKMKIKSEEKFFAVVHRVLEYYPIFEETLQNCDEYDQISDRVQDFLVEYLDDAYDDPKELRENTENIQVSKKRLFGKRKSSPFPNKLIVFLYSKMICFCETDKFNGIPVSRRFVENLLGIKNENYVIHHSHVTGEIIGFAHHYYNEKVR